MIRLSYTSLVNRKLLKASQPIDFVKTTAAALIEDAYIKIEKQSLDPLGRVELSLNRAVTPIEFQASCLLTEVNSYTSLTTPKAIEQIRKAIGYSPDIVSDIVKKIQAPVKGIIEAALVPISGAITAAVSSIKTANLFIESRIGGIVTAAKGVITTAVSTAQGVVTGAIAGVKTAVEGILDGVASLATQLMAAIAAGFLTLTSKMTSLFTFDTADIFNLTKELQDMGQSATEATIMNKKGGA